MWFYFSVDYLWGNNPPDRKAIAKYVENVETLVARRDNSVTDFLVQKLRTDCLSLKYLDISYTGCSNEAVIIFQNKRPDVELVHQSIESDYEWRKYECELTVPSYECVKTSNFVDIIFGISLLTVLFESSVFFHLFYCWQFRFY